MKTTKVFKLYGQCVAVKGVLRSIICDLQYRTYELIPNELFTILTDYSDKNLTEIIKNYGTENKDTIKGYFDFLISENLGFWTDTPALFPKNATEYNHPSTIHNAILDWNQNSNYAFMPIFKELEELHCRHIQLRFFDRISVANLSEILALLDESSILSVELILKYAIEFSEKRFDFMLRRFKRITQILVHSSPFDKNFLDANTHGALVHLFYTEKKIDSENHCGQVSPSYFAINTSAYTEALKHNSCLHKKIAIDTNGNIKNCPSMLQDFGNIANTQLKEALLNQKFKKYWHITKDTVAVCNACEFRYICTDCRAYTENNNPLGKPIKCKYNPHTGKWAN